MTPTRRRLDAVYALYGRYSGQNVVLVKRTDIAAEIRTLLRLGRTDRWHFAVLNWARMVEDGYYPVRGALNLGMIRVVHAA